jgi:hypothetical protein
LHGRQQQRHEHTDDRDDNEQLDESEAAARENYSFTIHIS